MASHIVDILIGLSSRLGPREGGAQSNVFTARRVLARTEPKPSAPSPRGDGTGDWGGRQVRMRHGTGPAAAARGPACSSRRCPAAGRHQQPSKSTTYTTLCACSSVVARWCGRARCLASSSCLPREETRARTKVSPPRETQQRRAGMQVQGCDARPGACGRAHQGRRWCGRRRRNRRFVDQPLVAHPLAPPSVILPTAPDLGYLPRARVERSALAR